MTRLEGSIALARTLTPALRRDWEWLIYRVTELAAVLKDLEWSGDFGDGPACPVCLRSPWPIQKDMHAKDCALALALRAVEFG